MTSFSDFLTWEAKSRDTLDFKKAYVDIADDLIAGLLLAQIIFWYLPDKFGKSKLRVFKQDHWWIAKARYEWWDECRLTPRQLDGAVAKLKEKGLITTKSFFFDGARILHLRIDEKVFMETWEKMMKTPVVNPFLPTDQITDSLNRHVSISPNGDSEITNPLSPLTEITTETTLNTSEANASGASHEPNPPRPSLSVVQPVQGTASNLPLFSTPRQSEQERESSAKEKEVQPHVAIIEMWHASTPEDIRPIGKPNIPRNCKVAKEIRDAGFSAEQVGQYVEEAYPGYRLWSQEPSPDGKKRPAMMSLEHVKTHIKAHFAKPVEAPVPESQEELVESPITHRLVPLSRARREQAQLEAEKTHVTD